MLVISRDKVEVSVYSSNENQGTEAFSDSKSNIITTAGSSCSCCSSGAVTVVRVKATASES